uniref:alanine--glyoxylate aminotransferase 2, mitochondrial isoform X2 n=1 Tax=Myxine glutinosa TaxID=7769 RepID=UPI00358FCCF0
MVAQIVEHGLFFAPDVFVQSLPYEYMQKVHHAHSGYLRGKLYRRPLLLHQGHMQWLWDMDGRRYLDLFSGIVTISVGHCHPKVVAAVTRQAHKLWHTTNLYMVPSFYEYIEKLAATLPEPLKVIFLVNSGSEANDLALFLAREHTGNFDILTLGGAYHGGSSQSMGLTSLSTWKHNLPTSFGIHATMCPDVFRGPWGGAHCRDSPVQTLRTCSCSPGSCHAKNMYVQCFRDVLDSSVGKKVAGFICEPIQGVNGAVQYPKGFLKEVFDMVHDRSGLCIADEVQTGFGRLGSHFWGFQSHDVMPDIVTMAKGIGNGFPLAAVVTTREIADSLGRAKHFNTFGGNPMACTVGSAVLDVIHEEGTQERSAELGLRMMQALAKFREEFRVVGDVRGKGLMIGLDLVKDKESRTPLPTEEVTEIMQDVMEAGVLLGSGGNHNTILRIKPPMCLSEQDVDFAVAVLHQALTRHAARH